MKKLHIFSCLTLALLFTAGFQTLSSQTYIYTKVTGQYTFTGNLYTIPGFVDGAHPGRYVNTILNHPSDNKLSEWQDLPFTWNFYGQPVNGYYASENGYITFDRGASKGFPANTALPDPTEPNDAIYAFWDDWFLDDKYHVTTNRVAAMTYGDAPNRKHMVMWVGLTPKGVSGGANENAAFFLILHEGGDFDIIHMASRKSVRMNGTIGVENHNGTVGTMVPGSPGLDFPPLTPAADDDNIYSFKYTDTKISASITELHIPVTVKSGAAVEINGSLKNMGSTPITSYDMSYQVDKGQIYKTTIKNVSIAANETVELKHPQKWQAPDAGKKYGIKVWVDNVNSSGASVGAANNGTDVFVQTGKSAVKNLLVEQFTGTWCVWCPDGSVQMSQIEKDNKKAVLVVIHAGGNDSMIIKEGQAIADFYKPAYPMALVDRYKFPESKTIPLGRTNDAWIKAADARLDATTPVKVSIGGKYNKKTRSVDVEISSDFVDYGYPGEYRVHFFVVEDRVKGTGKGYDQGNAYSGNKAYPEHIYYTEPNPIEGYVHRHVLRAAPTGAGGNAAIIPAAPVPGGSYKYKTSYTVPARFKEKDVMLIGFVTYENPNMPELNQVLNVAQMKLTR